MQGLSPQYTEFVTFFRSLSATAQHGHVVEDDRAPDANGQEKRTFTYQGFVFRSDDRGPGHKTMKRGFTSRNDLSLPENKTEAMGLGVVADGKAGGWGATGRSGVSCAKTVDGAINYLNPGGTFYVIDTTKLPAGVFYEIVGEDGEPEDSGDDWSHLANRLENALGFNSWNDLIIRP